MQKLRNAAFSALERKNIQALAASEEVDLIVIGGGITGAGIALDAASRGMKVVLLERGDFASGTSSRSTKLIHGGLRYLKQLEFRLVHEVGRERAIVHRLAPHLVIPEKLLLPFVKGGSLGKWSTSLGLKVYDFLANVAPADRRKMLSREDAFKAEPLLQGDTVSGAGLYAEYRTDDARLTLAVLKAASRFGALCLNHCSVTRLLFEDGKIRGVRYEDALDGTETELRARVVVNATGPWVDAVRMLDPTVDAVDKRLRLTKGIHLVFDRERLPVQQAIYFDTPDRRMIFAIPRGNKTYVGTTDTFYEGDQDAVAASADDARYLTEAVNALFPESNLSAGDAESSWAGLRPLIHEEGKSPSELSRKDETFVSPAGMISIAGGKLTGYRLMAKRVADLAAKQIERDLKACHTDSIALSDPAWSSFAEVTAFTEVLSGQLLKKTLPIESAAYLVHTYGRDAEIVIEGARSEVPGSLVDSECRFCIHHEMAATLCDFFVRRTGRVYFNIDGVMESRERILEIFRTELEWNSDRCSAESADLDAAIAQATAFKGTP